LCLLAILCDPEPPPLIGIEEPELGLHPDLLPKVADLLRRAALRTQLIVTTHSDILIDALSDLPESIVITEKHDGQTSMTRLSGSEIAFDDRRQQARALTAHLDRTPLTAPAKRHRQ
jgi:predicted ATPase